MSLKIDIYQQFITHARIRLLHKTTCHLFEKAATKAGISPDISCAEACFTVKLPEVSNEVALEKLENDYDELMDRDLAEKEMDTAEDIHTAGIIIQLKDGRNVYAKVSPELLNKVMQSISTDELNTLVCAITEAIEDPDEPDLCQH